MEPLQQLVQRTIGLCTQEDALAGSAHVLHPESGRQFQVGLGARLIMGIVQRQGCRNQPNNHCCLARPWWSLQKGELAAAHEAFMYRLLLGGVVPGTELLANARGQDLAAI